MTAEARGWQPISAVQPLYNIVNRDIEVELLPMARRRGLGVVTYSPLARGILTNKYALDGEPPPGSRLARSDRRFLQAEWRPASIAVARQLAPLAAARGCSPAQLATAWAMANPWVTSVIIGPRTVEQARDALGALSVTIDAEVEDAVDALVPPGCHSGTGWPDGQYPVAGRPR
jgi:aryl-alcohol dehydrogenase-like predicted oxidoreductase